MTDYRPIACAQHERLEFSVLRKIPLDLKFVLHGERKHEKVLPLDVNTRNGAEWLKFRREDGRMQWRVMPPLLAPSRALPDSAAQSSRLRLLSNLIFMRQPPW